MVSTGSPLSLERKRAGRLQAYVRIYRQYIFAALLPSVERNSMLRLLQTMQGKLISALDQQTDTLQLVLAPEEMVVLQKVVAELLRLYAKQPDNGNRLAIVTDLADIKESLQGY